jgi:hypothetical protein
MTKVSRRTVVGILGVFPALGGQSDSHKTGGRVAPPEAEKWMHNWMSGSAARPPEGGLYLGRFADPIYFLTEPIAWKPNKGQEGYKEVSVPVGFVTDLTSIPRVFWSLLRPDGRYAYAAILHDYLYWFQTRSREESDTILKLGMEDFSVAPLTISTIYTAVRAGGAASWSENERLRTAGEKRILKRFPQDPRTTWAEWKERADSFD